MVLILNKILLHAITEKNPQRNAYCIIPVIQSLKLARKNWYDRSHMVSGVLFLDLDGVLIFINVAKTCTFRIFTLFCVMLHFKKDLLKILKGEKWTSSIANFHFYKNTFCLYTYMEWHSSIFFYFQVLGVWVNFFFFLLFILYLSALPTVFKTNINHFY